MNRPGRTISASRRTDIPAFYASWLMNRIRAGYCYYPNPVYPTKSHRVSLLKEDVSGFIFWSRHPAPLIPHLSELDKAGFPYYFQYTVTGYPEYIDGITPSVETAVRTFQALSEVIGPDRIVWRYDPIILTTDITAEWHRRNFRRLADAIGSSAHHLVISIVDPYMKTQRRLGSAVNGVCYTIDAYSDLLNWIAAEAAYRNLRVESCAEAALCIPGIAPGRCVDAQLLNEISGSGVTSSLRLHKQREGCLCHFSVDIGVNNSCGFGCKYCYATSNHDHAKETANKHNSEWTCISQDVQYE